MQSSRQAQRLANTEHATIRGGDHSPAEERHTTLSSMHAAIMATHSADPSISWALRTGSAAACASRSAARTVAILEPHVVGGRITQHLLFLGAERTDLLGRAAA